MAKQETNNFRVNAFTGHGLLGNPAGVCLVTGPLDAAAMQAIAAENNLSETAFVQRRDDGDFNLRWFTPKVEMDLCGHATLAAAHVLVNEATEWASNPKSVLFHSRSGILHVNRRMDGLLELDFPSRPASPIEIPPLILEAFYIRPLSCWMARDLLIELPDEEAVRGLAPQISLLNGCEGLGVIVTAPGREVDFVSRFFAPKAGVPEDPVTGSAHCTLVPFWAKRLNSSRLHAHQVSQRGGELYCELRGDRVAIAGRAEIAAT